MAIWKESLNGSQAAQPCAATCCTSFIASMFAKCAGRKWAWMRRAATGAAALGMVGLAARKQINKQELAGYFQLEAQVRASAMGELASGARDCFIEGPCCLEVLCPGLRGGL